MRLQSLLSVDSHFLFESCAGLCLAEYELKNAGDGGEW